LAFARYPELISEKAIEDLMNSRLINLIQDQVKLPTNILVGLIMTFSERGITLAFKDMIQYMM
jgi:hypothetical protein